MPQQAKRVLINAPGPWFVNDQECLWCGLCVAEAPDLMELHEKEGCYFTKQPSTPEEEERALQAYAHCCINAIDYGGDDPVIIRRVAELYARWHLPPSRP